MDRVPKQFMDTFFILYQGLFANLQNENMCAERQGDNSLTDRHPYS